MDTTNVKKHEGSCHCGAVRFEVTLDATKGTRCNCSICTKTGIVGGLVKPDAFKLLQGEDSLGSYEWGHKVAKRRFCKHCGVQCFGSGYLEVIGGDFVSVNLSCLDDVDVGEVKIGHWDGRHDAWQKGMRETPWPVFTNATA